jgi:hypothetical protein
MTPGFSAPLLLEDDALFVNDIQNFDEIFDVERNVEGLPFDTGIQHTFVITAFVALADDDDFGPVRWVLWAV